jgi:hypothetical protein
MPKIHDESRTEKELRARFDAGRLQPCERCDSEGSEDPYCYELVKVSACPGTGDVVEDCDAEDHHYGLGQHVTTIEG